MFVGWERGGGGWHGKGRRCDPLLHVRPLECALHLPTVLQLHTPTLRLTRLAQEHRSTGRQLADHITAMFSAAISAAASSPDVVWDFHFSATHRSRSRAEPMVSKGSISFTNFW